MDSLTHIVLGAAIGEATLGRKIGNRALIWGAIGETIPDLDVFAGPFLHDLQAMAFHRGITHSILFAVVAPLLFGFLVHRLYATRLHATRGYKAFVTGLNVLFLLAVTIGINYAFRHEPVSLWIVILVTVSLALYLLSRLHQYYWKKELEHPIATFRQWYLLFFLTFITHILLDCCTAYGTQIFQPFSDYRAAFNNISVVDPLYTLPFLVCVVIMANLKRNTARRTFYNRLGLVISCLYLLMTVINKLYVDRVFSRALEHRHIEPIRTRSTATIFNNILWACAAEDPKNYYVGAYSLFDSDPNLHYLSVIPKNDSIRTLLGELPGYRRIHWFSDGYLAEFPEDSVIYLCDLRYGGYGDTIRDHTDLFMNFRVTKVNGEYQFEEHREPMKDSVPIAFAKLWKRIKGY